MKVAKNNLGFLVPFLWFLLGGAILLFYIEKGEVVLFFNENRTPFWTTFFCYFTKIGEEWSYVIALLIFGYFRNFREAATIVLSGLLTMVISFSSKAVFARPRPFTFFYQEGLLDEIIVPEGYRIYQGLNAFPSGHTMSAFALFGLIALLLKGKNMAGFILFIIAALIGFSRIYLFQHFFEDVFLGAICGFTIAFSLRHIFFQQYFLSSQFWERSFKKSTDLPV